MEEEHPQTCVRGGLRPPKQQKGNQIPCLTCALWVQIRCVVHIDFVGNCSEVGNVALCVQIPKTLAMQTPAHPVATALLKHGGHWAKHSVARLLGGGRGSRLNGGSLPSPSLALTAGAPQPVAEGYGECGRQAELQAHSPTHPHPVTPTHTHTHAQMYTETRNYPKDHADESRREMPSQFFALF